MQDYDELDLEYAGPDWWSRLMALGSLLVAITALWFARSGNARQATVGSDQVAKLVAELEGEASASQDRQAKFSQMMDQFEKVTAYRPNPDSGVASELLPQPGSEDTPEHNIQSGSGTSQDPSEDSGHDIESEMAESGTSPDADSSTESAESEEAISGIDDDLLTDSETTSAILAGETILNATETPQFPVDTEFVTAKIVNESVEPAVITHVKFAPKDVVEDVPTSIAIEPLRATTETELVVEYSSAENTSHDSEEQGMYFRKLVSPFTINPGESADLLLAIRNPGHIGFGMRGDLTLEFNTVESKVIPNAVLIFVGRPDSN